MGQFRIVAESKFSGLVKVHPRIVITSKLKLAEAKHCPGRAGLLLYLGGLLECLRCLGVLVVIVIKRPEKPPAFGPRRAQTHCLAVQSNSLIDLVGFTRSTRCRCDRVEILRARRFPGRRCHLLGRCGIWSLHATLALSIYRGSYQTGENPAREESRPHPRRQAEPRSAPD